VSRHREPWQMTLRQYAAHPLAYSDRPALILGRDEARQALLNAKHYQLVRLAVHQGKRVPADVLAAYPDLQHNPEDHPLFRETR
jgi:hypothetical protein